MIKRKLLLIIVGVMMLSALVYASGISQLQLAQLPERSELVVLAEVLRVDKKTESSDEVVIKVESVLKGNVQRKELHLTLTTRGVKGFDPQLKDGDNGVFFLREVEGSNAKLAYWGSVATFGKPYFERTSK